MELWEQSLKLLGESMSPPRVLEPRVCLAGCPLSWLAAILHGEFAKTRLIESTVPADMKILAIEQDEDNIAERAVNFFVYSETFDVHRPGDQMIDIAFRYESTEER